MTSEGEEEEEGRERGTRGTPNPTGKRIRVFHPDE